VSAAVAPTTVKAPAAPVAPTTAAKAPAPAAPIAKTPATVPAPAAAPVAPTQPPASAGGAVPVRAAAAPVIAAPAPAKAAPAPAPAAPAAVPPLAKAAPAPAAAPAAPAPAVTKPSVAQTRPLTAPVAAPAAPAAAAAAPVAAAPAAAAPAPLPKPAPELDQIKILEGHWRCDGRAPASAAGPEHAYKSSWKFKRDLDNFWWSAEYQQKQGKAHPSPLKARGYLTWDANAKSFVLVGVDNAGGTSTESTPGWSGDVFTLAGDASVGGKKIPYREVITKKGNREFTWRGEMKMDGDWVTLGEDRCKKQAAE